MKEEHRLLIALQDLDIMIKEAKDSLAPGVTLPIITAMKQRYVYADLHAMGQGSPRVGRDLQVDMTSVPLIEKKLMPHPEIQPKFGNKPASSPKAKAEDKPEQADEEPPPQTIMCKEHGVEMELKDGKWGPYYSHKVAEGKWCNLKVDKARKEGII